MVSDYLGWDIVPPTILRDGPFGEGMVQAFIEADPDVDVWTMVVEDDPRLRRMAVFDAAVNNTDRKGGHILPIDGGRHIHGVDHGVTFSVTPKLRTVLWAWRGEPMAEDEISGLAAVAGRPGRGPGRRASGAPQRGGGPGHGTPGGRAPDVGTLPAPLPDLAGHPVAAVLMRAGGTGFLVAR